MKTPPDDDASWSPEEAPLVFDLLRGISERDHFLTPDEERAGRKALAKLLRIPKRPGPSRGGLSTTELRERIFAEALHRLANLVEIDPGDESNRRIVFTNPRGQPLQSGAYLKNLKIFRSVEMLLKEDERLSVTEAIEKAANKHGVSDRWVWDIWRDFRTEQ